MFWKTTAVLPPQAIHIEVNKICNSRCKTCMIWAKKEDQSKLATNGRRAEIVEEFHELNPQGRMFVCGGEALLTPDRVFALTKKSNALGLSSQMPTNGSLIDDVMAEQLIEDGPTTIVLSLNSSRADVHDYTRGRPGSFLEVTAAIQRLQVARKKHDRGTKILTHTIVCEQNYRELEELHEFVLERMNCDELTMGFLQPTFEPAGSMKQDRFFAGNAVADEEALARILRRCDERFELNLNPAWIEQAKMYHRSIRESGEASKGWVGRRGTQQQICATYEKNITIDPQGNAGLCFSPVFRQTRLRRRGDLAKFWRGANDIRSKMKKCCSYCGMVDLNSRVSTTLETLPQVDETNRAA